MFNQLILSRRIVYRKLDELIFCKWVAVKSKNAESLCVRRAITIITLPVNKSHRCELKLLINKPVFIFRRFRSFSCCFVENFPFFQSFRYESRRKICWRKKYNSNTFISSKQLSAPPNPASASATIGAYQSREER